MIFYPNSTSFRTQILGNNEAQILSSTMSYGSREKQQGKKASKPLYYATLSNVKSYC